MGAPSLTIADLDPETRKVALAAAGRKRMPRTATFSKNRVRSCAIRVLAAIADLTPEQRTRVLAMAERMNQL